VTTAGSGHETRGCGVRCGSVGRLSRVCRRSRGVNGVFEAGEAVLVVVDDNVVVVDGGCAVVASGDVEGNGGSGGLETRAVGSLLVWVASSVVVVVVCIPKSMRSVVCAFFRELGSSSSGGSV
jgi:hypothetical protein